MKNYLEDILHTTVEQKEITARLPLYLKGAYRLEQWIINGQSILAAYPQIDVGVVAMRKHRNTLESIFAMPVVFGFESLSRYKTQKMMEEGIAFVIQGRQVFMPFLGVVLTPLRQTKDVSNLNRVSIQTQKFILLVVYQQQDKVNMAEAASELGVSRMTASRVFDELEAIDSSFVHMDGKARVFSRPASVKDFWSKVKPYLFNPAVRRYYLEEKPKPWGDYPYGGLSALSYYTMLEDSSYPTFALTREQEKLLRLKEVKQIPRGEIPGCVVHIVKYWVHWKDGKAMDPLSVILSLTEKEMSDPRVEGEVEVLLERILGE